jgi:hypothetical protein
MHMNEQRSDSDRTAAFRPVGTHAAKVCGAGRVDGTVSQYVHTRIQALDSYLNDHTDNGTRTKVRKAMVSVEEWRNERTHDAVIARLMGAMATPHTRTRAHVHTVTLQDGTFVHTNGTEHTNTHAMLRGVIEYRRTARRYRKAMLRTAYRGTLTRDGMSLGATTTANRLAPLDRAIALSDAFLYKAGDTVAMPQLARGVIRHDNGTVDAAATLLAAKLSHARKGR